MPELVYHHQSGLSLFPHCRLQALFLRNRLSYNLQLTIDVKGRVRNVQFKLQASTGLVDSAVTQWSPRLLVFPAQEANPIPLILPGKGAPYTGQPEVTERQVIAAAAAAAAANSGDRLDAAEAAAMAAQVGLADKDQASAAPESFFQK